MQVDLAVSIKEFFIVKEIELAFKNTDRKSASERSFITGFRYRKSANGFSITRKLTITAIISTGTK